MSYLPTAFSLAAWSAGFRFMPIGSAEEGLDRLVEFSLSRFSKSLTRASSCAIRSSYIATSARIAVWSSGDAVFYNGSGIEGVHAMPAE
jgi:hypothetical protein